HESLAVWDTATLQRVAAFSRPPLGEDKLAWVYSMSFSPDGKTLVTGHTDHAVTRWDWKAGKVLNHLHGHQGHVSNLAFFPDGERFASGASGDARIWEAATGKLLQTVAEEFMALSPDGKVLVTAPPRSPSLHVRTPLSDGPVRTIHVPGHF